MIKQYFKNFLYVFVIALGIYLSYALFAWAELGDAPLGLIILYSLLGWLLRYGMAISALAAFLTAAVPSRHNLPAEGRQLLLFAFAGLLIPGALLFSGRLYQGRTERVSTVLPRYRAHSVVRTFTPGRFFRGKGIMFRPGTPSTNGYNRSLLLLALSNGNRLFIDSSVIVEEKQLQIGGGWSIDRTLQTNSLTLYPYTVPRLFVTPPVHEPVEGSGSVHGITRFFGWRLFLRPPGEFNVFLEAVLFASGLLFLMIGAGLFMRREPMRIGHRFLAVALWTILSAGPVYLLHNGALSLLGRKPGQAGLFLRGGILLGLGLVVFFLGWRRYRKSLPPDMRRAV